jgi:hypothetical protein
VIFPDADEVVAEARPPRLVEALPAGVQPDPSRSLHVLIACALALTASIVLGLRAGDPGITENEVHYITWSTHFDSWVNRLGGEDAFGAAPLRAGWGSDPVHQPHPPLAGLLGWAGDRLAPASVDFPARLRLGGVLVLGVSLAYVYYALWGAWGWIAALGGVIGLLAQPRLVGQALHLGPDAPTACACLVVLLALGRCADGRPHHWVLYLALPAAFALKLTWLALVPILLGWCVFARRWRLLRHVVMASALGLGVLLMLCLPGGQDPWVGLRPPGDPRTLAFLGGTYPGAPPWHGVLLLLTAAPPTGVVAAGAVGLIALARGLSRETPRRPRPAAGSPRPPADGPRPPAAGPRPPAKGSADPLAQLLLVAVVVWTLALLLPLLPWRGGGLGPALHLCAALGCAGGAGFALAAQRLVSERGLSDRTQIGLTLACLLLPASGLHTTWTAHPHLLSTYGAGVGGLPGAVRLGLPPVQGLEVITADVLADINRTLPEGATVSEARAVAYPFFLRDYDLLRDDLQPSLRGDYVLVLHDPALLAARPELLEQTPVRPPWTHEGVPLVWLMRRDR